MVSPLNEWLIKKYSKVAIKHQPIFIIGAPRTGSTIFYQALTNVANVCYFNNIVGYFYQTPLVGALRSKLRFGSEAHECFSSQYGATTPSNAPSECGEFWYRWLPKDRHYIGEEDLATIDIDRIRKEITAYTNFFNKPLVFKNLNAGQRIALISQLFPNAKFIICNRQREYTLRSILKARFKNGIEQSEWWSIKPKNYLNLLKLQEVEMCLQQILHLEKQIETDTKIFIDNSNVFSIQYNELSNQNIYDIVDELGLQKRKKYTFPVFVQDNKSDFSNSELIVKYTRVVTGWNKSDK